MLVQIRDRAALSSLPSSNLRQYLKSHGWKDAGKWGKRATIHTKKYGRRNWEILIPISDDVADYAERMAESIATLATVEKRSQIDVFYDITKTGSEEAQEFVKDIYGQKKRAEEAMQGVVRDHSAYETVIDKPYFDKDGVIWLKTGADKRRVNSKEELRRLFQISAQFYADELPTQAGVDKLDKLRFRDFLREVYNQEYPDSSEEMVRLLQNMNLATEDGHLNLAGVLMFAEQPEWITPQFVVKAIRYPGNKIHVTDYVDTEDFAGPLSKVFDDTLAFVMRNLHKVQAGRGVNAPGLPEVPISVFEELLVNALVHRDYLISAPIRLFIFDNCIEIISPGHLPNNLTVEKILSGNSNIRNPILVSYVAKGLLPYHGLGSGIKRALDAWPQIDFVDDHEGNLFTATVHRKPLEDLRLADVLPKSEADERC